MGLVKALTTKPDDLSLVPRTHAGRRANRMSHVVAHACVMCLLSHTVWRQMERTSYSQRKELDVSGQGVLRRGRPPQLPSSHSPAHPCPLLLVYFFSFSFFDTFLPVPNPQDLPHTPVRHHDS